MDTIGLNERMDEIKTDIARFDIHKNLEAIMAVAEQQSKDHRCNYTVILHAGNTYEYVTDSYFEKERPHCEIIHKFEYVEQPQYNNNREVDELINMFSGEYLKIYDDIRKLSNESLYPPVTKKQSNQIVEPVTPKSTINRNDKCSCGSGKKYKHCCINSIN